jgi:hypothetical protein
MNGLKTARVLDGGRNDEARKGKEQNRRKRQSTSFYSVH